MKACAVDFPGLGADDCSPKGQKPGPNEARADGPARCNGAPGTGAGIPVVVLLAVNAAVLGEAGELGLEGQLTFTAFQASQVPLFVHGQQVVPVRDLAPAAGAQGGLLRAQRRHALQGRQAHRTLRRTRGRRTRGPGAAEPGALAEHRRGQGPACQGQHREAFAKFPLRLTPFLRRPPQPTVRPPGTGPLRTRTGRPPRTSF